MLELSLRKPLGRQLRLGHPWVYDGALAATSTRVEAGQVVAVRDRDRVVATGYADPSSPIRVRVLAHGVQDDLGPTWVTARVEGALRLRDIDPRLRDTDCLRLIHGEGDLMPGLIVDLYLDTAVVMFDGSGASAFWEPRMRTVFAALEAGGRPVARAWLRRRRRPGRALLGDPPPQRITVREGDARFEVDVIHGQKTGLFLDQRENRRYLGERARDKTVLNLFGYTGGFSIHAGLGGARRTVTVDQARPAMDTAARNLEHSGLDPRTHELVCADAFAWLEATKRAGRRFDIVVCDPPSFAPSAEAKPAAQAAYRRLNGMALGVVAPGGRLLTASCSSHFTRPDLRQAVAGAAQDTGRHVVIVGERGPAGDHPVLPGFPEGDYLDLLDCAVDERLSAASAATSWR